LGAFLWGRFFFCARRAALELAALLLLLLRRLTPQQAELDAVGVAPGRPQRGV
jgi:hypothetical protein